LVDLYAKCRYNKPNIINHKHTWILYKEKGHPSQKQQMSYLKIDHGSRRVAFRHVSSSGFFKVNEWPIHNPPKTIHKTVKNLPTFKVDVYGKCIGKYTSQMDPMGSKKNL